MAYVIYSLIISCLWHMSITNYFIGIHRFILKSVYHQTFITLEVYIEHIQEKGVIIMKKNKNISILLLLISIITITMMGCSRSDIVIKPDYEDNEVYTDNLNRDDLILSLEGYGAKGALVDKDMSIVDMLMYAAQDEYLARAEYAAIIEEFNVSRPYTNIMRSEETHLDSLRGIYETYKIEFPTDTSKEQLVIPTSLLEAAKVGVQAEIDNIAMYESFLSYDLPEYIENVFNALMKGSINHLKAFQTQVDKLS
jgi:hypothetical protein